MSEAEKSDRLLGQVLAWTISTVLLVAILLLGGKVFQLNEENTELRTSLEEANQENRILMIKNPWFWQGQSVQPEPTPPPQQPLTPLLPLPASYSQE